MPTLPDSPPPETAPAEPPPETIICTATGEERPVGTPLGGPAPKTNAQLLADQQAAEEARQAEVTRTVTVTTTASDPLA